MRRWNLLVGKLDAKGKGARRLKQEARKQNLLITSLSLAVFCILFFLGRKEFVENYLAFVGILMGAHIAFLTATGRANTFSGVLALILAISVIIAFRPGLVDPEITETDKNVFAAAFAFGSFHAKTLFRIGDEALICRDLEKYSFASLLEELGFPNAPVVVRSYCEAFQGFENLPFSGSESRVIVISKLSELLIPFKQFISAKYGERGESYFTLGVAVPSLYRILFLFRQIDSAMQGQLTPYEREELLEGYKTLGGFWQLFAQNFPLVAVTGRGLFPEELRSSIHSVATEDIYDRHDRERLVEQLIDICFRFDMVINKQLRPVRVPQYPPYDS
jgi:hypothetical protein